MVPLAPVRNIHEYADWGQLDNHMRFKRVGEATRLAIGSDYELPGKLPVAPRCSVHTT